MKKILLTCLMLFVALSLFAGGSGEKKGKAIEEIVIGALSTELFDSEAALVRIDMSEYMEKGDRIHQQ